MVPITMVGITPIPLHNPCLATYRQCRYCARKEVAGTMRDVVSFWPELSYPVLNWHQLGEYSLSYEDSGLLSSWGPDLIKIRLNNTEIWGFPIDGKVVMSERDDRLWVSPSFKDEFQIWLLGAWRKLKRRESHSKMWKGRGEEQGMRRKTDKWNRENLENLCRNTFFSSPPPKKSMRQISRHQSDWL